jgi:hypothetical protein
VYPRYRPLFDAETRAKLSSVTAWTTPKPAGDLLYTLRPDEKNPGRGLFILLTRAGVWEVGHYRNDLTGGRADMLPVVKGAGSSLSDATELCSRAIGCFWLRTFLEKVGIVQPNPREFVKNLATSKKGFW